MRYFEKALAVGASCVSPGRVLASIDGVSLARQGNSDARVVELCEACVRRCSDVLPQRISTNLQVSTTSRIAAQL